MAAGQNPVRLAWSWFAPTKAASSSHQAEKATARVTLTRVRVPARANAARSRFIGVFTVDPFSWWVGDPGGVAADPRVRGRRCWGGPRTTGRQARGPAPGLRAS